MDMDGLRSCLVGSKTDIRIIWEKKQVRDPKRRPKRFFLGSVLSCSRMKNSYVGDEKNVWFKQLLGIWGANSADHFFRLSWQSRWRKCPLKQSRGLQNVHRKYREINFSSLAINECFPLSYCMIMMRINGEHVVICL